MENKYDEERTKQILDEVNRKSREIPLEDLEGVSGGITIQFENDQVTITLTDEEYSRVRAFLASPITKAIDKYGLSGLLIQQTMTLDRTTASNVINLAKMLIAQEFSV